MSVTTAVDMSVTVGGLKLRNPVMPASGTFADGLDQVMDFNRLGALVTKTITRELRTGNPLPRVVERPGSLINAIGIPSKGVPHFIEETLPYYAAYDTPLVVSISAPTAEGFAQSRQGIVAARRCGDRGQYFLSEHRGRRQGFRDAGGSDRKGHAAAARIHKAAALGQAHAQYR